MAKVEPTKEELERDAKEANRTAPKNPADAARAKLLKDGTAEDRRAKIEELKKEIEELEKPPMTEYPKMKYHPDQPATTVNDAAQEKALGDGWVDSMEELPEVAARMKGTKAKGKAAEGPAKVAHDEVAAGRGTVR